jgi:hypothetical protein
VPLPSNKEPPLVRPGCREAADDGGKLLLQHALIALPLSAS